MKREQLLYYAVKYKGNVNRIQKAIEDNESYEMMSYHESYITLLDDIYPSQLKQLYNPPYVLFYKGDIHLLESKMISIIGSRNAQPYGINQTKWIVSNLNEICIVSGLAKGIDAIAHISALQHSKTIAVIGCGLDVCYPKENLFIYNEIKNNHLILSEYPSKTVPLKHHFIYRNRIIAALGSCLIVTQAKIKSGTMITVYEALELGKDVYTVPYQNLEVEGEGCNLLIQQGANSILNDMDVMQLKKTIIDK